MKSVCFAVLLWCVPQAVSAYRFGGYVYGEVIGDQFGSAIDAIDFNDDGYRDLVVGAPASDAGGISSGKVYVYFGGPETDTIAEMTIVGAASSFFGQTLASAGDFNNDGADDLLVGAPFFDRLEPAAENVGAVYLFYGGSDPDGTADYVLIGENDLDYFGNAVTSTDFNADGISDIVVGAYKADWGAFVDAGRVYVYCGSSTPDLTVDYVLTGEADGERFGYSVTAGDFSGDGFRDIAAGAYSYDAEVLNVGRVYLFRGGASPNVVNDLIIQGVQAGAKFGWTLGTAKMTGDNYSDLIMGTDGYSVGGLMTGRVYVYDGGPLMDNVADYTYDLNRPAEDFLGSAIAAGNDVDYDAREDMIVGMPGNNNGGIDAGGAILFSGGDAIIEVDSTLLGGASSEQAGQAVFIWPGYEGDHVAFGMGGPGYGDYRGRLTLLVSDGPVQPNRPPVLDNIFDLTAVVYQPLALFLSAVDPDNDALSLSAEQLPAGASFIDLHDNTATFSWTPDISQLGTFEVRFMASDGEFTDSALVAFTVLESCCVGRVGDANGQGTYPDEVTLGDIMLLVDVKFVSGNCNEIPCYTEADVNQDGEAAPSCEDNITLGDIMTLVDFLFITGPENATLPNCL